MPHPPPVGAASTAFLRDLENLASELARATDFAGPAARFQILGGKPGFLDGSVQGESPLVDLVLAELARRFDRPRAAWQWLKGPLRHEPSEIIHGLALVGRLLATVFYFEKHGVGLITLAPRDGVVVHHARFSGLAVTCGAAVTSRGGRA